MANHVGRSLQYTRREYIRPMVEAGKLSLTLPDKPKSKYQRYRLTNAA
ncbi:Fic family protein [Bifidobacterium breve]